MSDLTLDELGELMRRSVAKMRIKLDEADAHLANGDPLLAFATLGGNCSGFLRLIGGVDVVTADEIRERALANYRHLLADDDAKTIPQAPGSG